MVFLFFAVFTYAGDCKNRGTLDEIYCDENMADTPKDPAE